MILSFADLVRTSETIRPDLHAYRRDIEYAHRRDIEVSLPFSALARKVGLFSVYHIHNCLTYSAFLCSRAYD